MLLALLLGSVLLLAGCTGDECSAACRHLINDCGVERANYGVEDCSAGCEQFIDHYRDEWQASESRKAVRCVRDASCDELQDGMPCFDEAVYVW
ncbi:MAG: hypothetical protein VX498_06835 [Myxococcota bacterium]|nr:hypothetical protein [Myxococcota bacterium]